MPTLHWIGKEKVVNHHQEVPFRVLEHKYGFRAKDEGNKTETKSGNKIIHGDNLEALKALLPEYEGKIKCIYIDPPYNTGNEKWVYNDNVNDPKIKKWLGEVVGKQGEDLSRHDKWLCMMYPRLKLLHKLLANDGAIFISIDDNEIANLKLMCNEIFGVQNFLGHIVWKKKTNGNNMGEIPPVHDFITVYAKSLEKLHFNGLPLSEEYINKNYSNPDNDPRGLWTTTDLSANHEGPYFPILNENTKEIHYPPKNRYWVFNSIEVERRIKDGRIIFGKSGNAKPVQKVFLNERILTQKPDTWFDKQGFNSDGMAVLTDILGGKVLNHPKPVSLIKYILQFATDKDSIVLDSFAGSGTTAHAVLKMNYEDSGNRKFILVEIEDYAETITAERIKRVINGYTYYRDVKECIYEKSINVRNIVNGAKYLEEAQDIKNKRILDFDKINIIFENNVLKVISSKKGKKNKEGTGGEFDYYELGMPILKEDKNLNEEVSEDKIREYIYYTETKQHLERGRKEDSKYLLDTYNDTGYYFYYEKEQITTLSWDTLNIVTERAEQYVIYADICIIDENDLAAKNIVFKKIPRDIKRF